MNWVLPFAPNSRWELPVARQREIPEVPEQSRLEVLRVDQFDHIQPAHPLANPNRSDVESRISIRWPGRQMSANRYRRDSNVLRGIDGRPMRRPTINMMNNRLRPTTGRALTTQMRPTTGSSLIAYRGVPLQQMPLWMLTTYHESRFDVAVHAVDSDTSYCVASSSKEFVQPNPPYTPLETEALLLEWALRAMLPHLQNKVVEISTSSFILSQLLYRKFNNPIANRVADEIDKVEVLRVDQFDHIQPAHPLANPNRSDVESRISIRWPGRQMSANRYRRDSKVLRGIDGRPMRRPTINMMNNRLRPTTGRALTTQMRPTTGSSLIAYRGVTLQQMPLWMLTTYHESRFDVAVHAVDSDTSYCVASSSKEFVQPNPPYTPLETEALLLEWALRAMLPHLQNKVVEISTSSFILSQLLYRKFNNPIANRVADEIDKVEVLRVDQFDHIQPAHPLANPNRSDVESRISIRWPGRQMSANRYRRDSNVLRGIDGRPMRRPTINMMNNRLRPTTGRALTTQMRPTTGSSLIAYRGVTLQQMPLWMLTTYHESRFDVAVHAVDSDTSYCVASSSKEFVQPNPPYTPLETEALLLEWALRAMLPHLQNKVVEISTSSFILSQLPYRKFNNPIANRVADEIDKVEVLRVDQFDHSQPAHPLANPNRSDVESRISIRWPGRQMSANRYRRDSNVLRGIDGRPMRRPTINMMNNRLRPTTGRALTTQMRPTTGSSLIAYRGVTLQQMPLWMLTTYHESRFDVAVHAVDSDTSYCVASSSKEFVQPNPPYTPLETEALLLEWALRAMLPHLQNKVVEISTSSIILSQLPYRKFNNPIANRVADAIDKVDFIISCSITHACTRSSHTCPYRNSRGCTILQNPLTEIVDCGKL